MLLHEVLKDYRIILGSASPRRAELMSGAGFDFEINTNFAIDETYPVDMLPEEVPSFLSRQKSMAYGDAISDRDILITADTVVICKGKILGKPENESMAHSMLRQLSAGEHAVITGVTIRSAGYVETFSVTTQVKFNYLSDARIDYYIRNYNPFDKAGSYGIQEWIGYVGIEEIVGSYYNVVGLPIQSLYARLSEIYKCNQ